MKKAKILSVLCAAALCASMLAACGGAPAGTNGDSSAQATASGAAGPDISKPVHLTFYLYGGDGVANKDILAAINQKLQADINATLEIKYIDWGDVSTKYPLLFASGEPFDMAFASPSEAVSYYTLAAQGALCDITDLLGTVAPKLQAEVPDKIWANAKYDGRIYGVPNLYSEFIPYGFVYRKDLQQKYGVADVTSLETMEAYLDAAKKDGSLVPMNLGASDAGNLFHLFMGMTSSWIDAPGIPKTNIYLAAASAADYKNVFHPAFTDEFANFCKMTRDWADKGYWSKDVMSAQQGGKANTTNNLSASYITHMSDWTGNYGAMADKLPGVQTDFWCPAQDNHKILRAIGGNETVISANSPNPDRALMTIEKFMTDESYYRLLQYGIEGREYEIVDGVAVKPTSYNPDVDAGGFSAWSLRNDRFNIPYKSEDPRRYELNKEWNKTALDNPYQSFSFDDKNVRTELASISNVNSNLGIQLLFGKTQEDVDTALAQYREQLKSAGIDKVIDEVKSQLANFTPAG